MNKMKKKFPRSIRKRIRRKKAAVRKLMLPEEERKKRIVELYEEMVEQKQ